MFSRFLTGRASSSVSAFKDELRQYWFLPYSRSGGSAIDSSGFEHVFFGEIRQDGSAVTGFHNWVFAYEEEKGNAFQLTNHIDTCPVWTKSVNEANGVYYLWLD